MTTTQSNTGNWIWPRLLAFPVLAVLGYVGFVLGWGGGGIGIRLAWATGLGYCWFCVVGSFHETVHQTLTRNQDANIWLGRIVGTLLGIPYSAYRETHIRHHAYLNTPDDYELWPYSSPQMSVTFRRAFAVFEILGGVLSGPVVYGRIFFKHDSPLSQKARSMIAREYIGVVAFWGLVAITVSSLVLTERIELGRFDFMWLLPMPIAAAMNTFRKFTEHLGMSSTDPILGTRTVIGGDPLTRLTSYFNFEEFVHGPHHRFPKTPHFLLEDRLQEYQRRNSDIVAPVFHTYLSAVWDMLPSLWNPGVGENVGGQLKYHLPRGIEDFESEVGSIPIPVADQQAA